MSEITLERYNSDAYRIMSGGEIVGMALKLANGAWSLCDKEERRVSTRMFHSPFEARDAFAALKDTPRS